MKFRHYLETITGISIYPLISLVIFTVFFAIVLLWVIKARKSYINELKQLPLEDGSVNANKTDIAL